MTDRDRTLRLRAKYAERVEHLALARYYTNLPEADRELFAKYALGSTREEQDRSYYYLSAIQLLDCKILEAFFIYGWEGDDTMPERLIEMAGLLDEQCNLQYAVMLESAKLKSEGRQLSDAQKEKGRLDMLLKEAARRRLAGIPFDDEVPSNG